MLVQNFIKLRASVRELSCLQTTKTLTETIQSVRYRADAKKVKIVNFYARQQELL